jgi:hypothetical protein
MNEVIAIVFAFSFLRRSIPNDKPTHKQSLALFKLIYSFSLALDFIVTHKSMFDRYVQSQEPAQMRLNIEYQQQQSAVIADGMEVTLE